MEIWGGPPPLEHHENDDTMMRIFSSFFIQVLASCFHIGSVGDKEEDDGDGNDVICFSQRKILPAATHQGKLFGS